MPAPPGSGKSTLCAALVNSGWRLLSDELTLVRLDGLLGLVPRPISLKIESIDFIRGFARNTILGIPLEGILTGTVAHVKAPADSVAGVAELARRRG